MRNRRSPFGPSTYVSGCTNSVVPSLLMPNSPCEIDTHERSRVRVLLLDAHRERTALEAHADLEFAHINGDRFEGAHRLV